ncbi:histidine phosphatase family protein [Spirochaeta africana]|uniref:Fructose-2,6-bisphosphatase n=1 Tax=Spirochaeta africana (strain ATCC 700263 / DSM 8902 / Z-7692) TaxID=889378 RepID=H9UMN6_SPIAZ|nr:histidine phosphatase family protein [Spirochaeta africana]AFG38779.1 fructose-2,6-bisphosphatase [Spirochaeta africana DSM 8902]
MPETFPIPDFHLLQKRLRVYFIRHGESEGNSQGILQGRQDYPLSELGREQCRAAATYLADRGIEHVLTSPLLRARETADIIASAAGLPQPVDNGNLVELDTGLFTGMTIREIEREYPAEWSAFHRDSWEAVPDAESIASLWGRAISVWNEIIETANQGPRHILAVTHGGLLQWIIKTSLGARPQWLPLMSTANCGIFEFLAHPVPQQEQNNAPPASADRAYYGSWITINASA